MSHAEPYASLRSPSTDVDVSVPAGPEQLSVIRAVAVDIALRQDYDIDAIADLRMAVDEAGACLLPHATDHGRLSCTFNISPDGVEVTISTIADATEGPQKSGLGWHVLTALTDSVSLGSVPTTAGHLLSIRLRKLRGSDKAVE